MKTVEVKIDSGEWLLHVAMMTLLLSALVFLIVGWLDKTMSPPADGVDWFGWRSIVLGAGLYALAGLIRLWPVIGTSRRRWAAQLVRRAGANGAPDDSMLCAELLRAGMSTGETTRWLRRSTVDELERQIGRPLPRLWVVGTGLVDALTAGREDESIAVDPGPFWAHMRPRPPHAMWGLCLAAVVVVIGAVALTVTDLPPGVILLAVCAWLLIGAFVWKLAFAQEGWRCEVDGGQPRFVRRNRRGEPVANRNLTDPDLLVIATCQSRRISLNSPLHWTLLLSTGERIVIDGMPAPLSPWTPDGGWTRPAAGSA